VTVRELFDEVDRAVRGAADSELPTIVGRLVEAEERARLRMRGIAPLSASTGGEPDENLSAQEAARRLGMSTDWLYKANDLPFRIKIGRRVVFSARGLERWSRQRSGR
jgi:predicted DNA-binding transcriptional regulator AlpA